VVVHYLPSSSFTTLDVRHTPVDPLAMFGAQGVGSILAYGNDDHLI